MTFRQSSVFPIDPRHLVGIAIKAYQGGRFMHVGLVYVRRSGEIYLAHLASHNEALDEPVPNDEGYFWDDCEWLADPELDSLRDLIANFVELCAVTKEIPYGPDPLGSGFDPQGRYIRTDVRAGLTCATYISAMFAGIGFPVVDLSTWISRPDDKTWWSAMTAMLGRQHPERTLELEGLEVGFRLRPNEVAVATASPDAPINFHQAVERSYVFKGLFNEFA